MVQSVVIGLPCTAHVGNDTAIVIVLYFERFIANINLYYLSCRLRFSGASWSNKQVTEPFFQEQVYCESRDELPKIRGAVISKMTCLHSHSATLHTERKAIFKMA